MKNKAENGTGNAQTDANQDDETDPNSQSGTEDTDTNQNLDAAALLLQVKKNAQEAKKYRQSLATTKAELDELKRKAAEKDGNWQAIAESSKAELATEKGKTTKLLNSFGTRLINEAIEREATKLGAVDSESILALLDTSELEVDEELKVDSAVVKAKVEELRKKKPFLFKKADPKIYDVNGNKNKVETGRKTLDQMNPDELMAQLRTMK